MRCVVYDNETMEPLTVVDLKARWVEHRLQHRTMKLPIFRPVSSQVVIDEKMPVQSQVTSVDLRLMKVRNAKGAEALLLLVDDPENALLVNAATLPGQHRLLQEAYADGFGAGIIEALKRMLG